MPELDHLYNPCGRGTKTSAAACFLARLGGSPDLCHYFLPGAEGWVNVEGVQLSDFCQRPKEEHNA